MAEEGVWNACLQDMHLSISTCSKWGAKQVESIRSLCLVSWHVSADTLSSFLSHPSPLYISFLFGFISFHSYAHSIFVFFYLSFFHFHPPLTFCFPSSSFYFVLFLYNILFSVFRLLIFLNLCPSLPFIYCFCSSFKSELNLSLRLVMNQAAETNTREEVQLQLFLTSPLGSGECLAWYPICFAPVFNWIGGWLGARPGLDTKVDGKNFWSSSLYHSDD